MIDDLRSLSALETLLFHIDDDDSSRHVLHLRPYLPKEGLNLSPTLPPLPLNQPRSMLLALPSLVPSAIPARASTHPVDTTILSSSNTRTRTLAHQRASISTTSSPSDSIRFWHSLSRPLRPRNTLPLARIRLYTITTPRSLPSISHA